MFLLIFVTVNIKVVIL